VYEVGPTNQSAKEKKMRINLTPPRGADEHARGSPTGYPRTVKLTANPNRMRDMNEAGGHSNAEKKTLLKGRTVYRREAAFGISAPRRRRRNSRNKTQGGAGRENRESREEEVIMRFKEEYIRRWRCPEIKRDCLNREGIGGAKAIQRGGNC